MHIGIPPSIHILGKSIHSEMRGFSPLRYQMFHDRAMELVASDFVVLS